jgi:hypothetical protein
MTQGWHHPSSHIVNTPLVDIPANLKSLWPTNSRPRLPADFIPSEVSGSEASGRLTATLSASACARPACSESLKGLRDSHPHPFFRQEICLSRRVALLFRGAKFKRDKIRLLYSDACGIVSTYGNLRCGDRDAAAPLTISLYPHLPLLKSHSAVDG